MVVVYLTMYVWEQGDGFFSIMLAKLFVIVGLS